MYFRAIETSRQAMREHNDNLRAAAKARLAANAAKRK